MVCTTTQTLVRFIESVEGTFVHALVGTHSTYRICGVFLIIFRNLEFLGLPRIIAL